MSHLRWILLPIAVIQWAIAVLVWMASTTDRAADAIISLPPASLFSFLQP